MSIKWIIIVLIIIGTGVAVFYHFLQEETDMSFLDKPDAMTVYALSIDGLDRAPMYQDPESLVVKKSKSNKIPDELFREYLMEKEKVTVLDSVEILVERDNMAQFFLVRTQDGKFGYVANYRVAGKEGEPLGVPPYKGIKY